MSGKKIGIFAGGDVSALNSVINNVVYRSTADRHEVTGVRNDWEELTNVNPKDPIPDPHLGPRRVDVDKMYLRDRCRPNYANKEGLPVFFTGAE